MCHSVAWLVLLIDVHRDGISGARSILPALVDAEICQFVWTIWSSVHVFVFAFKILILLLNLVLLFLFVVF